MGIVNFRYKYIFATICLLGIFLCGYNFNRWDAANGKVKKNIFIIYSFSKNDVGNGNFEEYVMNGFVKEGIEPFFHRFYLGCDSVDLSSRTALVKEYLEIIKNRQIDMILTVGDQSTSALLSTRHPFLQSVPVVACNVRFPDEKLLAEYDSARVYVLRDVPDFVKNIEFIVTLQAHTNLEILYNIDFTPLGRKSFDLLTQVVDRQNVRMSCSESSFPFECDYRELKSMVEYYTLMPAVAREDIKKNKLTVSLCPFRYMKGGSLLVMMEKSEDGQGRKAFLMDRFDAMALPVVHALDMPAFSCLREGFGEEARIVGGYMATDETSAGALVALSVRVLGGGKAADAPRMVDIEKEYVLDWTYFSAYDGYGIKNVPADVRIINYPFYVHYREELYLLGGVFVLAFVLVSVILLRTRRRSRIEHENLAMLEEAHKRLTLSTGGGQISLWNIQGGEIEFDENFSVLTGMKARRFTKDEFLRYLYRRPAGLQPIQRDAVSAVGNVADTRTFQLRQRRLSMVRIPVPQLEGSAWRQNVGGRHAERAGAGGP